MSILATLSPQSSPFEQIHQPLLSDSAPFNWMVGFLVARHDASAKNKHLIGLGVRTSYKLMLVPSRVDMIKRKKAINHVETFHTMALPKELDVGRKDYGKEGLYTHVRDTSLGETRMMLADARDNFGGSGSFTPVDLKLETNTSVNGKDCYLFGYRELEGDKRVFSRISVLHKSCQFTNCVLSTDKGLPTILGKVCADGSDLGSPVLCAGKLTYIVHPINIEGCGYQFEAVKVAHLVPKLKEATRQVGDPINF